MSEDGVDTTGPVHVENQDDSHKGALAETGTEVIKDRAEFELDNKAVSPSTDGSDDADLLKPYYFGFRSCHPKFLQFFAHKRVFTALMCLFILLQGSVVTGYTSVNVSSVEKRYSFRSSLTGLYLVVYDVTIVIGILFVTYFGGKSHKPRVMGVSLIIMSIGCLILSSPQFLFGSYKPNTNTVDNSHEECTISSEPAGNEDCTPAHIGGYIILLLGQIVIGIGATAAYTVALAYIDEIVYPKYVSLHFGVVLIMAVIGPAIGYLLGSTFLNIYVDPWEETNLEPSDPAWVGAWWIGPLLNGVVGLFVSVLFFMFPKWLPDSHLVKKERAKEMAKIYPKELVNEDNLTIIVKQFPVHIKRLLTNASFMFTGFGLAMLFIIRDGVTSFGPKYIQSMFDVTASDAGLISGIIAITGAAVGVIAGALIVYIWKPVGRNTAVIHTVVIILSLPFVLVYLIKCSTPDVAGITVSYTNESKIDGRDSAMCSMNCSCQSSVYEPVCGDDGITYFSACRAGCRTVYMENGSFVFENCTCITAATQNVVYNSTAVEGICPTGCNQLIPFLIVLVILVSLLLTIEIPYYRFALRVVSDEQRHLALGLQSAILRVFGAIPGGLLFGAVVDLSCIEWDYNCGVRGNCWIYDNDRLSLNAILLCLPFGVLSIILLLIGMATYPKRPVKLDHNTDDVKE